MTLIWNWSVCVVCEVRATERLQQSSATCRQQIESLESQVETAKSQISSMSSGFDNIESRIQTTTSHLTAVSSRINAVESQVQAVQSQITAVSSRPSVTRCRLCFREIEGTSQCQRSRNACSGWSTSPSWTSPFRDDTDGRGGGCTYQWRLECAWSRWMRRRLFLRNDLRPVYSDTTQLT